MSTILIILVLILLLGGGGYYGHSRYGGTRLGGVLGLILVAAVVVLAGWRYQLIGPSAKRHARVICGCIP